MCWSFLPHVRFLILLTVFELLPKTCNFTICSIFSNSGHVGWCTASLDIILKLDTLVMIQTKFGFHWSSTFRGEDFWKSLRRTTDDDDGRQVMGIAQPDPPFGSGELKKCTYQYNTDLKSRSFRYKDSFCLFHGIFKEPNNSFKTKSINLPKKYEILHIVISKHNFF